MILSGYNSWLNGKHRLRPRYEVLASSVEAMVMQAGIQKCLRAGFKTNT